MFVPDQGDIVWLDFEPSSGKEITKRRPGFVISRSAFNAHTVFIIAAPITSTVRGIQLEVVLSDTKTEGAVLIYQLKALDFIVRNAVFIERASAGVTAKISELSQLIVR